MRSSSIDERSHWKSKILKSDVSLTVRSLCSKTCFSRTKRSSIKEFICFLRQNQPAIELNDLKKRPKLYISQQRKSGCRYRCWNATWQLNQERPFSAFFNLLGVVALNCFILRTGLQIRSQRCYDLLITLGGKNVLSAKEIATHIFRSFYLCWTWTAAARQANILPKLFQQQN